MLQLVKERFRSIRKEMKLNQEVFGINLGTNQVSITEIENGRKNPGMDILLNLRTKYNINLNWFIAGIGPEKCEPPKDETHKPDIEGGYKALLESKNETIEALRFVIETQKRLLASLEEQNAELKSKKQ